MKWSKTEREMRDRLKSSGIRQKSTLTNNGGSRRRGGKKRHPTSFSFRQSSDKHHHLLRRRCCRHCRRSCCCCCWCIGVLFDTRGVRKVGQHHFTLSCKTPLSYVRLVIVWTNTRRRRRWGRKGKEMNDSKKKVKDGSRQGANKNWIWNYFFIFT